MQQQWPRTLEEAVRISILTMTVKEKDMLRNTTEEDLVLFHCNWAVNMRNEFGLWDGTERVWHGAVGSPGISEEQTEQ